MNAPRRSLALAAALLAAACNTAPPASGPPATTPPAPAGPTVTIDQVPGHAGLTQDTAPKSDPRLVPAEAYIRTYLSFFGYLYPGDLQTHEFPGGYNGLFDSWQQYTAALGLPNYASDLPRGLQTNLIMVATFERLGIALCDRAVERDLKSGVPVSQRGIFAFDVPPSDMKNPGLVDEAGFGPRFDVLHTTFLGYPAALAPTDRTKRFFDVYTKVASMHDPKKSKLTAGEAGWAAVCYGLIRHPEFHLY
jgi:hypothetical protein